MTAVIEFQHVTKIYKRLFSDEQLAALNDVSFEAMPGQVCAFLGPNGAGKTTSISMLMGFFFPTSGDIRVFGMPPGDIRGKAQIGFLPENFAFHKFLTAPKLLRYHLQLAGRNPSAEANRIPELLAQVKLAGYENLKIGKYSGAWCSVWESRRHCFAVRSSSSWTSPRRASIRQGGAMCCSCWSI